MRPCRWSPYQGAQPHCTSQKCPAASLASFCLRNTVISSKAAEGTIFCPMPDICTFCSLHGGDIYGITCLLQPLQCFLKALSQRDEETYAELNFFPAVWVSSGNTTGEAKREEGWRTIQRPVSSTLFASFLEIAPFLLDPSFKGSLAQPYSRQWAILTGSQRDQTALQPQPPTSWPAYNCPGATKRSSHCHATVCVCGRGALWSKRCGKCGVGYQSLENSKCTFEY